MTSKKNSWMDAEAKLELEGGVNALIDRLGERIPWVLDVRRKSLV